MSFVKTLLKLIGIPLLKELGDALISYLKFLIEQRKKEKDLKAKLKEAIKNARRYKESNFPDDFNKLP